MTDLAALGLSVRSDGVVVATDRLDDFSRASDGAAKGADNTAKSSNALSANLRRLAGIAGAVVGSLAGAFSVAGYIKAADAWSDMSSQVGAAIGDMSKAGDMMQRLTEIANASYAPLDQTVQVYARNIGVLRDLGKSATEAADFTEALNHALVITATKGERAASVQDALSKAMAVGKLQADGLETVLANGGKVAELLAEQLGTTVSGLRQMASDGKITGEVIANALIGNLDELRIVAAEMPATVGDGFTRINTGAIALIGSFDQAVGASGALAGILVSVGDALAFASQNIETVIGLVIAASAAALIQFAPAIYGAVAATYAWVASLVTLKGVLIATGVGALIVGAGILIGEFLKLVTAAGGFGNAMVLLKDVAVEVWDRIKLGAESLARSVKSVAAGIQSAFISAFAGIMRRLSAMTQAVAEGINGMFAPLGINLGMTGMGAGLADALEGAAQDAADVASRQGDAAQTFANAATAPLASIQALRDAFKETKTAVDDVGVSAAATGAAMGEMGGAGKAAAEKTKEEIKELDDLAKKLGSTFGDLFIAATKGADAFRSALSNVLSNLASMLANAAFTQLFRSSGGGLLKAVGSLFGALVPSADGNVFQGGSLVPFANGGVIGGPTVFPMRGGRTGLMGEAGPEAIMPLRRGRDGKLGVAAQSQQAAPVDVRVYVDENGNWQAAVERIADKRVQKQGPSFVRQSVQAVYAANSERRLK
jgi:tape measure domain-containing protein